MAVNMRVVAICAGVAAVVAGGLAIPVILPALADEQQNPVVQSATDFFESTPKFDPKSLRKFDVDLNEDQVSTQVMHRERVTKIGFGQRTVVSIITTSTGTYSSDGLVSPYVRYPGIDVTPRQAEYYYGGYGTPQVSTGISTTPYGTYKWSSVTTGSFTYYNSSFVPARRH